MTTMPQEPSTMYRWRKMTPQQRAEVFQERIQHSRPCHSIPHATSDTTTYYMVTAACFEHKAIIGYSPDRMRHFENDLVELLNDHCHQVFAWAVLPNHYHVLIDCPDITALLRVLGQLHGRNSFYWNGEENQRGRQVWCNAAETAMKSEGHYYASLNYVLHNAVHHGYVAKWTEWPYCNAQLYLEALGREKALQIWNSYPLYDYGKDWDPPGF
jgi:putative transposase